MEAHKLSSPSITDMRHTLVLFFLRSTPFEFAKLSLGACSRLAFPSVNSLWPLVTLFMSFCLIAELIIFSALVSNALLAAAWFPKAFFFCFMSGLLRGGIFNGLVSALPFNGTFSLYILFTSLQVGVERHLGCIPVIVLKKTLRMVHFIESAMLSELRSFTRCLFLLKPCSTSPLPCGRERSALISAKDASVRLFLPLGKVSYPSVLWPSAGNLCYHRIYMCAVRRSVMIPDRHVRAEAAAAWQCTGTAKIALCAMHSHILGQITCTHEHFARGSLKQCFSASKIQCTSTKTFSSSHGPGLVLLSQCPSQLLATPSRGLHHPNWA